MHSFFKLFFPFCLCWWSCTQTKTNFSPPYAKQIYSTQDILAFGNPYSKESFETTLHCIYASKEATFLYFFPTQNGLYFCPNSSPLTYFLPWNQSKLTSRNPISQAKNHLPLSGLLIGIDPGHIGGEFAKIEERFSTDKHGNPFAEGNATLIVANLLKTKLESRGAKIYLTRTKSEPTHCTSISEISSYLSQKNPELSTEKLQLQANKEFSRIAEMHTRALNLNVIKPDFILCLHFDAPSQQSFQNNMHAILHGAYSPEELADGEIRSALCAKLFSQSHLQEEKIAHSLIEEMAKNLNLPPHHYNSPIAKKVDSNPYLYRRNLLANRIYPAPVIFLEAFNMNEDVTAQRLAAGHYKGIRQFNGQKYISIFEEYAEAVARGVEKSFSRPDGK